SPPGVLALTSGSEVIIDCAGEVTVNGVPVQTHTQQKERLRRRAATTRPWTPQREGDNTGTPSEGSMAYHSTAMTALNQNKTATGTYAGPKGGHVTTVKTPITTEEQAGNGTESTVSQRNRLGGAAEEGGAFGVTMEMGISSERGTTMEYEDYEDYEDTGEGLRVTRSIKRQTRWTRNGQRVRGFKRGRALRLPDLRPSDAGNYSCYKGDSLISSVIIRVGVAPEKPTLSCHRKFHTSKMRCEWISKQPIIPRPVCYLLIRNGFSDFSPVPCSYSPERSRCWCALSSEEGNRNTFTAKLCVTNTVGNATSNPYHFNLHGIKESTFNPNESVKPDPPAKVEVKALEGQPCSLGISWFYPATWKQGFYYLQFQLRYRPLLAKEYQHVLMDGKEQKLVWYITDAAPHIQYEVQLRAKDEFDGVWSEWTDPVYAYTWTAPEPTIGSDLHTSMEPFWNEGSGFEEDPKDEITEDTGIMWVHVLWVFGLCLLISCIMLLVYSLRLLYLGLEHRIRFMSKLDKPSCSPPCSCPSSPPAHLQQPLMAPHQLSQHHFRPVPDEEGKGINLHNFDYFFSPGV
ncbi:hypothetical protein NFI96_019594, partial [Prochilodus magdalenae]